MNFPMTILHYGVTDGTVAKIQPPYVNKWYGNTETDVQLYWEAESQPSQSIILMENEWPEEELDFSNHQLISMLNISTQIYHNVQTVVGEGQNE